MFRTAITGSGFRENKIAKALYVLEKDGDIKGMLVTHVDNLCWAARIRRTDPENIRRVYSQEG